MGIVEQYTSAGTFIFLVCVSRCISEIMLTFIYYLYFTKVTVNTFIAVNNKIKEELMFVPDLDFFIFWFCC